MTIINDQHGYYNYNSYNNYNCQGHYSVSEARGERYKEKKRDLE